MANKTEDFFKEIEEAKASYDSQKSDSDPAFCADIITEGGKEYSGPIVQIDEEGGYIGIKVREGDVEHGIKDGEQITLMIDTIASYKFSG